MKEKLKEWKCTQCKDECILKIREDDGSPTFCPFGMDSFKNRPVEPKWEIINTPQHESVEEITDFEAIKGLIAFWRDQDSSGHYDILRDIDEIVSKHIKPEIEG